MIAPLRMRQVAVLLLLLLAPGLLTPAGLWLHVCRCEALGQLTRTCCHASAGATTPSPARTCCQHRQRSEAPVPAAPEAQGDDCGCTWEPIGNGPEPATPPKVFVRPPALPPQPTFVLASSLRLAPTTTALRIAPRLRAPPPPHAHRNLPLRL